MRTGLTLFFLFGVGKTGNREKPGVGSLKCHRENANYLWKGEVKKKPAAKAGSINCAAFSSLKAAAPSVFRKEIKRG